MSRSFLVAIQFPWVVLAVVKLRLKDGVGILMACGTRVLIYHNHKNWYPGVPERITRVPDFPASALDSGCT